MLGGERVIHKQQTQISTMKTKMMVFVRQLTKLKRPQGTQPRYKYPRIESQMESVVMMPWALQSRMITELVLQTESDLVVKSNETVLREKKFPL